MTTSINMLLMFIPEQLLPPAETQFIASEDDIYLGMEDGITQMVTEGSP